MEIAKNLNPVTLKDFIETYPHLANLLTPILEAVLRRHFVKHYKPICWAAMYGYGDLAKILLENGADIYTIDDGRMTAFHWAASRGMIPLVELLLSYGFEIDERDGLHNKTGLHHAVEHSRLDMARYLVGKGADISLQCRCRQTLAHLAVSSFMTARSKIPILQFLVELGVDLDARDGLGKTALHLTAENYFDESCDAIRFLIEHGVDVNARDQWGGTALRLAAQDICRDYRVIDLLLEMGADTLRQEPYDRMLSELSIAFKKGRWSWDDIPRNTIFVFSWDKFGCPSIDGLVNPVA